VGIVAALALVGAIFGVRAWQKQSRLNEVAESYASFRACLYGAPLEEGEKPSDRLVAMELCGPMEPSKTEFPQCRASLRRALAAWDALGVTEADPRYGEARKATRIAVEWTSSETVWLVGAERPQIDGLEAALAAADLPKVEAIDGGKRCTEKARFSAGDVVALGKVAAYRASTSPYRERTLRAVWSAGTKNPSLACWFSSDGPAVAACGAPTLENIAQPYASSDDLEDVVVYDFRSEGDFSYRAVRARSDQTLYATKGYLPKNAWARSDGTLVYADFEQRLMKVAPGGEPEAVPMGPAAGAKHLGARPGFVVFTDKLGRSYRAPLGDDGVGERVDIGNLPEWRSLRSCMGKAGPVLVMLGVKQSSGGDALFVYYPTSETSYAEPLVNSMPFPAPLADPDDATVFPCTKDGTPRWAWVADDKVGSLSCPPSGCVYAEADKKLALHATEVSYASVAPLGDDRFLFVYEGNHAGPFDNLVHAVRVRSGTLAEIATAHDDVLLTEEAHGGLPALWGGVYAFGSGDTAWAMVRADNQLYAFRTTNGTTFEVVRPK
jgi:hypothetical protein